MFESQAKVRFELPKALFVGNFNQEGLLVTFQTVLDVTTTVFEPPSFSKVKSSGFTSNIGIIFSPFTSFLFELVLVDLTSCSEAPQLSSYKNSK